MLRVLADLILVVHAGIALFVILALPVIVIGNLRGWRVVNALAFRLVHVAAIGVVVLQAWLGMACPLTTLESWLRVRAGDTGYSAGFIEHWVARALFYSAPAWIFMVAYTAFGLLVALCWWYFPPTRTRRLRPTATATARGRLS